MMRKVIGCNKKAITGKRQMRYVHGEADHMKIYFNPAQQAPESLIPGIAFVPSGTP